MKNVILLTFLFIGFDESMIAQDSASIHQIVFNAKLKDSNRQTTIGYLYVITDSLVLIAKKIKALKFFDEGFNEGKIFKFANIEKLQLQRKGSAGTGAILGFLTGGFGFGIAAALSVRSAPQNLWNISPSGGSAFAGGFFVGGIGGALVGACIAALIHKTFFIHGKKERFDKMRNEMISRLTISKQ